MGDTVSYEEIDLPVMLVATVAAKMTAAD